MWDLVWNGLRSREAQRGMLGVSVIQKSRQQTYIVALVKLEYNYADMSDVRMCKDDGPDHSRFAKRVLGGIIGDDIVQKL